MTLRVVRQKGQQGGEARVHQETIRPHMLTVSLHQRAADGDGHLQDEHCKISLQEVTVPLPRLIASSPAPPLEIKVQPGRKISLIMPLL